MLNFPKIRTCLWFEKGGLEAARFYISLLPNSRLETDDNGLGQKVVNFTLCRTPYQILNGGPHFKLSEAASISVSTQSQEETDRLWAALTSNGGQESRCGWLKDRWGVSWQIVPLVLPKLLGSSDRSAASRTQEAMMRMGKLIISDLERAFEGD